MFDAVVLLALTFGGVLQLFAGVAASWFSNPLLQGTALIALFVVVTSAIDLPFSYYRTFNIEARFGFNKMTRGMWLGDLVKHAAVAVRAGPAAGAGRAVADAGMGAYWWVYVWLVWVAFSLLVMAIYPAFIAPLFNKFSPHAGGLAQGAHRAAAGQVRLQVERAVRDGRLAPQQPRQRLLHRLRQDQAHRVLRHAASRA